MLMGWNRSVPLRVWRADYSCLRWYHYADAYLCGKSLSDPFCEVLLASSSDLPRLPPPRRDLHGRVEPFAECRDNGSTVHWIREKGGGEDGAYPVAVRTNFGSLGRHKERTYHYRRKEERIQQTDHT